MSELTQADLKLIEEKLKGIEDKMGSKWTVPILVAVVSGVIAMTNVIIQARFERQRALAEHDRIEAAKAEDARIADGEKIYAQMYGLTSDIRRNFRSQCRSSQVDDDKFFQTLETLRDFTDELRVTYDAEEPANIIRNYGEWVAETVTSPERVGCMKPDGEEYEGVEKVLKSWREERCSRKKQPQATGFMTGFF